MLLIETFIAASTIPNAGLGCFANEFVPKGTKIWELNSSLDRTITFDELSLLTELEQRFVKTYAYSHNEVLYLCIDNARFFNHSNEAYNTYDPSDEFCTYASRDINIGEEIISDYSSFGVTDDDKQFNLEL
jgi:SET domain-containing protein